MRNIIIALFSKDKELRYDSTEKLVKIITVKLVVRNIPQKKNSPTNYIAFEIS